MTSDGRALELAERAWRAAEADEADAVVQVEASGFARFAALCIDCTRSNASSSDMAAVFTPIDPATVVFTWATTTSAPARVNRSAVSSSKT